MSRRRLDTRTGWWVLALGAGMLALGAGIMFTAVADPWATVGLVVGLMGGGGMGTGLSILLFPDARIQDELEDLLPPDAEPEEYPDPVRTPPHLIKFPVRTFKVCESHGIMGCAECD